MILIADDMKLRSMRRMFSANECCNVTVYKTNEMVLSDFYCFVNRTSTKYTDIPRLIADDCCHQGPSRKLRSRLFLSEPGVVTSDLASGSPHGSCIAVSIQSLLTKTKLFCRID